MENKFWPDLGKETALCIVLVSIFPILDFFQKSIGERFVAQLFETGIKLETTQHNFESIYMYAQACTYTLVLLGKLTLCLVN